MTDQVEWRPIVGYEGIYEVSSAGEWRRAGTDRLLSTRLGRGRKIRVELFRNGKGEAKTLRRLVAQAFIPNPDNLPDVSHKDGDPSNCAVENLKWKSENPPPIERFESNCIPEPNSGCWLWLGTLFTNGHGQQAVGRPGKHTAPIGAHRYSWTLYRGPIPEGMQVLHKCDVRSCVNPDHLFLGTHQDNMDDMVRKGRARNGANGRNWVK